MRRNIGRRACCVAAAIAATITLTTSGQEQLPRLLPLRGEAVLERLSLPPELKDLAVSPDGRSVAYVRTSVDRETLHYSRQIQRLHHDLDGLTSTLWLCDLATGRRTRLEYDGRIRALVVAGQIKARWSHDSRRLALLEQTDGKASLVTWDVDAPGRPTRHPLVNLRSAEKSELAVDNWTWISERDIVVLGLVPTAKYPVLFQTVFQRRFFAPGENEYAFFRSRYNRDDDVPTRPGFGTHDHYERRPLRLQLVWTRAARITEVHMPEPMFSVPVIYDAEPMGVAWTLANDRRHVLIPSRDPRLSEQSSEAVYQMAQIHRGAPEAREIAKARSRVYALDVQTGEMREVYAGGPGRISAIAEVPNQQGNTLAVVEEQPRLAIWPAWDRWASIRRVDTRNATSEDIDVPDDVWLASALYRGVRNGRVYRHESGRWSQRPRIEEVDVATGTTTRLSPPDMWATWCDVSSDGRTVVAVLENVQTPPELHRWHASTQRWQRVADAEYRAPDHDLGPVEVVTWRSRDDRLDLTGILIKPPNLTNSKRLPLIVFINGGVAASTSPPENQYSSAVGVGSLKAHVLASEGYLVFIPNFRGTAGHSRAYNEALIGQFGRQWDYDIEAGIDKLIATGDADPERLGIMGFSAGSDEAIYALAHSKRFKAAVIESGDVMLPEVWLSSLPLPTWYIQSRDSYIRLIGFDPVEKVWADAYAIGTPILMRYGGSMKSSDRLFDRQAQVDKLAVALRKNNVPYDIIVDRDGHAIVNRQYLTEYHSRVLQWFDHFILGRGESPLPAPENQRPVQPQY
jgi:dipeptidyl aminopeptidase/acylaminoacyl peptidase